MEEKSVLFLLTPKTEVAYLLSNINVRQALEKIRAHGYQAIPVLSKKGEYLGSITQGDLLYAYMDNNGDIEALEKIGIKSLIRKDFRPAVKIDASFTELADMIVTQNFVPVVDDRNILMGIVTRRRVLQELLNKETK